MDSSEAHPRQPIWRLPIACILAGVAVGSVGYAEEHCPVVEMLEPAGGTIAESRPLFQWKPLPGVDRYRVRLQSRVPEGELLVSIDTLIEGTSFRPPRPLTSYRAIITVSITAACTGGEVVDSGVRKQAALLDLAEQTHSAILIVSGGSDAAEKLEGLGGVAAKLKFKV